MKKLYLAVFICWSFIICSCAQQDQTLTNDVLINEHGIKQALVSYATLLARSNALTITSNKVIGDKELWAEKPNLWLLYNPSNSLGGVLLPKYGHTFAFELWTTNGVQISKTAYGESISRPLNSLVDNKTKSNPSLISPFGYKGFEFPALTNLFNFPSNGVYIFELRCWAWQASKKQFALSDPIRVKVIAQNIVPTVSNIQTNSAVK